VRRGGWVGESGEGGREEGGGMGWGGEGRGGEGGERVRVKQK